MVAGVELLAQAIDSVIMRVQVYLGCIFLRSNPPPHSCPEASLGLTSNTKKRL